MNAIKHILFVLFFLIISSEFIQNHTKWLNIRPLEGGIILINKPKFKLDKWLSGNFQDTAMNYYEQTINMHTFFTRVHNQIEYSVFNKIKVNDVVEGKNQMLFSEGNTKSFYGKDFVGENVVIEKVNKLVFIQEGLKKRNIDFIFVITPNKSSFYSELLPEEDSTIKKTRTNYDAYIEQFEKQKINYIDFPSYFVKLKPVAKHSLFTRCGIHWSIYGSTLAADTLIKYMETLRHIDMPDYYYAEEKETTQPQKTDDDIGRAMNLLHDISSFPMCYPNLIIKKDKQKTKPDVLFVGDSYFWSWIGKDIYIPNLVSNKTAFWYYNREVAWPQTNEIDNYPVEKLNLKEQTLSRDFIIISFNESALANGGYGFIEQMYDLLKTENEAIN